MLALLPGTTYFPPKELPGDGKSTPLTILDVVSIDPERQSVKVEKVLGAPSDLAPGSFNFQVEPRAKSGNKPGMNLWYKAHKPA